MAQLSPLEGLQLECQPALPSHLEAQGAAGPSQGGRAVGSGLRSAPRGPSMGSLSVLTIWWLVPQSTWPGRGHSVFTTKSLK